MGRFWKRFFKAREGNVAIITALAAIPMCFLVGMSVDYGTAADRQVQLNAYADAAALATVTPNMMAESVAQATTAAQNTFNGQASTLSSITWNPANLTVNITTSGSKRNVTVSYTATYNTFFPSLLGRSTMALSGSSSATGGISPNINFYLLLDDSPSMAIAATTSGINTMVNNTQGQCDNPPYGGASCGCAFGCHESNPSGESHYIQTGTGSPLCAASNNYKYCSLSGTGNPGGEDNYALARALGVPLRIDLLAQAAANLMTTAQTTEEGNNANYEMAIYSFDYNVNTLQALTSNLTTAQGSAENLSLLEVSSNNYLTSSDDNEDEDTDFQTALNTINTTMPNPGSGTDAKGDTPQEVLFLVTDGLDDVGVTSAPSLSSAYGSYCCTSGNTSRQQSTLNPLNSGGGEPDTDWCATIKGRGIRIAVLYTQYLSLTTNGWYNTYVQPMQPPTTTQDNVAAQLQTCASPGLFYQVTTDGDISAALASLFNSAVQTAYLSK